MAQSQKKAPAKAAAARKEGSTKERTVEWEGLELTLPPEPPEEMLFDMAEFERGADAIALYRILRSLLGPDQFIDVRNKVAELREADPETFHTQAIAEKVLEEFGMTLGESSASQKS